MLEIPKNKDDFDNFQKWQLDFRTWKCGKTWNRSWIVMEFDKLKRV